MISIIGAGPAGCFLGYLLAKNGKQVSIFEEHSSIGKPVQCTGIVTKELLSILDLKDYRKKIIINRLKKVNIFSKKRKLEIPCDDLVIDRQKFDKHIAQMAKKAGAKIYINKKFLGVIKDSIVVTGKDGKPRKIRSDHIIGADGPLSDVAKANKMFGKRRFFFGMQARVRGSFDPSAYEVYLGSICPGFFAWIVPESGKTARIGIASKNIKKAKKVFDDFLKKRSINTKDIIEHQAGLIPVYDRHIEVQKSSIFLLGDAAAQVKATTGGGIVQGLKAAKKLSRCILKGDPKAYKRSLTELNKELKLHSFIRKTLDNFTDKDYNALLNMLDSKNLKNIFRKNTRDTPKKLLLKALVSKPSLLIYTTKFINRIHFPFTIGGNVLCKKKTTKR